MCVCVCVSACVQVCVCACVRVCVCVCASGNARGAGGLKIELLQSVLCLDALRIGTT